MDSGPAEVVFSVAADSHPPAALFSYRRGLVKVPSPWKRGRPKANHAQEGKQHGEAGVNRPPTQFEFVNTSLQSRVIDDESRARIRRHVKSKDKHQIKCLSQARSPRPGVKQPGSEQDDREVANVTSKFRLQQIMGVDPFNTLPIKLESYMYDLLVSLSNTISIRWYFFENLAGWNPMVDYWLPMAFQDAALLHSFIGCADTYTSGYRTIRDNLRGLQHLDAAVSTIKQRLATPHNCVSHGTIATVAGLAMLEKGSGSCRRWHIHMQGLKRLVDAYGGIGRLHSDPLVLSKIYRADLYGSLDTAQPPFFEYTRPADAELCPGFPFASEGFKDIHDVIGLDPIISSCVRQLEDITSLWSDTNDSLLDTESTVVSTEVVHPRQTSLAEAIRARHLLTEVQYTLVSSNFQRGSGYTMSSHISELCRVSLILYSSTLLNEHPASAAYGEQVGNTFRRLLTPLLCQSDAAPEALTPWLSPLPVDFCLWTVTVAAYVVKDTVLPTRRWLLASFVELVSSPDCAIQTWEDLRCRLGRYLWVPRIHDAVSRGLWAHALEARGSLPAES